MDQKIWRTFNEQAQVFRKQQGSVKVA